MYTGLERSSKSSTRRDLASVLVSKLDHWGRRKEGGREKRRKGERVRERRAKGRDKEGRKEGRKEKREVFQFITARMESHKIITTETFT